MEIFLIGAAISMALVFGCTILFYEIMAHTWVFLPRLKGKRMPILFTVGAMFLAHSLAVWIFGATDYVLDHYFHFGSLRGQEDLGFFNYIYFSGVTYSSLGFGHVDPVGGLQLIAVVESILGLVFIGWTVTFTFLATEKYLTHRLKTNKRSKD